MKNGEVIRTRGYWTKDRVFEESKKYKAPTEFAKGSSGAYQKACKEKWIDKMFWLQRKSHKPYTKEEVLTEAKKYKTKKEFENNERPLYRAAVNNKWIDSITWFIPQRHKLYTKEEVLAKAKKYKTKQEFRKDDYNLYCVANRHKWMQEMDWFIPIEQQKTHWVYVYYLPYNTVYVGITCNIDKRIKEHSQQSASSVFKFCKKFNITSSPLIQYKSGFTASEAQEKEDELVKYFYNKGCMVINDGKTGRDIGSLGSFGTKWRRKGVFEEAKKYKYRADFKKNNINAYNAATRNHWLKEMTWLLYKRKKTKSI